MGPFPAPGLSRRTGGHVALLALPGVYVRPAAVSPRDDRDASEQPPPPYRLRNQRRLGISPPTTKEALKRKLWSPGAAPAVEDLDLWLRVGRKGRKGAARWEEGREPVSTAGGRGGRPAGLGLRGWAQLRGSGRPHWLARSCPRGKAARGGRAVSPASPARSDTPPKADPPGPSQACVSPPPHVHAQARTQDRSAPHAHPGQTEAPVRTADPTPGGQQRGSGPALQLCAQALPYPRSILPGSILPGSEARCPQ